MSAMQVHLSDHSRRGDTHLGQPAVAFNDLGKTRDPEPAVQNSHIVFGLHDVNSLEINLGLLFGRRVYQSFSVYCSEPGSSSLVDP
jgi:hypothetical protein